MSILPTFLPLLELLQTFGYLKHGVSEGETPPQKLKKKCNSQTQFAKFGAYLLSTFPENPFFFPNEILAFIMSIPPNFFIFLL